MGKLHLDLRVTNGIPDAYKRTAQEISQMSGANLGNLVFRHALQSLIADFAEYRPVNYPQAKQIVAEHNVKSVLVSCANWLGTREQDEKSNKVRADIIQRIDAPVVSFGLGTQAAHGVEELQLGPESKRLARVLASKSHSLSVRDQLTAETLRSMGLKNIVVTGCPSNFLNIEPDLGGRIVEKATQLAGQNLEWSSIRTCISEFSGGHPESGEILRVTLEFMEASPAFYVAQSPVLLPFLTCESDELPKEYRANSSKDLKGLQSLIRARGLYFSSVDGWLDFARTCSFSFGMRIHGTIVPIQAGVPALLIGHDSRTAGLAQEMAIPSVGPKEFLDMRNNPPHHFFQLVAEKLKSYDTNRQRLAGIFMRYLQDNGLTAAAELSILSSASNSTQECLE